MSKDVLFAPPEDVLHWGLQPKKFLLCVLNGIKSVLNSSPKAMHIRKRKTRFLTDWKQQVRLGSISSSTCIYCPPMLHPPPPQPHLSPPPSQFADPVVQTWHLEHCGTLGTYKHWMSNLRTTATASCHLRPQWTLGGHRGWDTHCSPLPASAVHFL